MNKSTTLTKTIFFVIFMTISVASCSLIKAQENKTQKDSNIETVLSQVDLNFHKVSEAQISSMLITSTSPDFWSVNDPNFPDSRLIAGKAIKIQRDLGLLSEGRAFVDQQILRLGPQNDLESHIKYWWDKGRDISFTTVEKNESLNKRGEVELVNYGRIISHEIPDQGIPFPALGKMQIATAPNISPTGFLRSIKFSSVTQEKYRGLLCWKLSWEISDPEKKLYTRSGYTLICPERDYKEIYREDITKVIDRQSPIEINSDRFTVEKLTKYGDVWVPSQVYREWKKVGFDGTEKILVEKFRATDFRADSISVDLLFEPLFSPGTRIYRSGTNGGGGEIETAGTDISKIIGNLKKGDLSDLKEELGDLG